MFITLFIRRAADFLQAAKALAAAHPSVFNGGYPVHPAEFCYRNQVSLSGEEKKMHHRSSLLCVMVLIASGAFSAEPSMTIESFTGIWKEKSGNSTYIFGSGYNFEYHREPNPRVQKDFGYVEKGIWTLASDNCSVGQARGNLYIQAGTDRCCYNAYFLGQNLVLTALAPPQFVGVCSDRVLVRNGGGSEG